MRAVWWLVVMAMVSGPVALEAQDVMPDRDRRQELERRIRGHFLAQIAERLELTTDQQEQVRGILRENAEARTDLALESHALRIDLMQAVRDEDASMTRFEEILNRLDAIRERERAIEQREESALSEVLNPRQQAVFLFMRMQFNDRIRQMRGGRGGPAGPGPGGPGGPGGPV